MKLLKLKELNKSFEKIQCFSFWCFSFIYEKRKINKYDYLFNL